MFVPKKIWWLLLASIVGGIVGYFWTPERFYEAETVVKVPEEQADIEIEIIKSLQIATDANVQVERKGESGLISVQTRSSDPASPVRAANSIAQLYLQQAAAKWERQQEQALSAIRQKIDRAEQELLESERALQEFKLRHPYALSSRRESAARLEERHSEAIRKLRSLDSALSQLQRITDRQLDSATEELRFHPPATGDSSLQSMEGRFTSSLERWNELQRERRRLLRTRTEEHPQVQKMEAQWADVRKDIARDAKELMDRYLVLRQELETQKRALGGRLAQIRSAPELTDEMEALQRRVELRAAVLADLQKKLKDAELQQESQNAQFTLVKEAKGAELRTGSPFRGILAGMLAGLALGALMVLVAESISKKKTASPETVASDLEKHLEVPVLGSIPPVKAAEKKDLLCSFFDPQSEAARAYSEVQSRLEVLAQERGAKILLVTSSVPREGKTSLACNLALLFSKSGKKTLLIDANLRDPAIHQIFGLEQHFGLSEVLRGVHEWKNMAKSIDDVARGSWGVINTRIQEGLELLWLLTAGRTVENAAQLLSLSTVSDLLKALAENFDYIVLDAPAALTFPDVSGLAPRVDATVLTHQVGKVDRDIVRRTKARLEGVKVKILGVVLYPNLAPAKPAQLLPRKPPSPKIEVQDQELDDIMRITE